MGLKGTLRGIGTVVRQIEREGARRQRELDKQQKNYMKMKEFERAAYEVDVYENYIDRIISIHKDCGPTYNWQEILKREPPKVPERESVHEGIAQQKFDKYKSNFFEKLFGLDTKKRQNLEFAIETAKSEDDKKYKERLKQYQQELDNHKFLNIIADNIIKGNLEYYKKAYEEIDPISEISDIGSSAYFSFQSPTRIKADLCIHDEKIIPKQAKSLLKSGKLTIKDIPQGKYNEMYQKYVCSSSIRVGREFFALLPIKDIVLTTKGNVLNQLTGTIEEVPILSVLLTRERMNLINFEAVDPSECIKNFKHNMEFKKNIGMLPVSEIE